VLVSNQGSAQKFWPKVRFPGGKTVLLEPKEFEYQNSKGEELATRHQVPLILAWACVSMHTYILLFLAGFLHSSSTFFSRSR
jgi:hypothetical protein